MQDACHIMMMIVIDRKEEPKASYAYNAYVIASFSAIAISLQEQFQGRSTTTSMIRIPGYPNYFL
jgi:hypothetical protein